MAPRPFTVFQDRSPKSSKKTAATAIQETRIASYPASPNAPVDDTDKENVNPTTGERGAPPTITKKRKTTSAPSVKSHAPLATKSQVDLSEAKPTSKKRKASSKTKPTRKNTSAAGKGRRPTSRTSPLSKVEEERESEREIERIRLADIDSRCYQLTVKPLADLSEAYGCPQTLEGRATGVDDGMLVDKDCVFDLEPCDYSVPVPPTPPPTPTKTTPRYTTSFSTSERKLLFAAFTFSSPSLSSERLKKAKSVDNGSARPSPSL